MAEYGDDETSGSSTGSVEGLGLNKKPKKKNPLQQGLLQMQNSLAQQKQGVLANAAKQQGALGTVDNGAMSEVPQLNRKKKPMTGV